MSRHIHNSETPRRSDQDQARGCSCESKHDVTDTITTSEAMEQGFALSVFTAIQPKRLSKGFTLDAEGELVKLPGGNLSYGTVETMRFSNITQLADWLPMLTPAQAVAYGACGHDHARVVRAAELEAVRKSSTAGAKYEAVVSRTRDCFTYRKGPGVWMRDYDPATDATPMKPEALLAGLYEIIPALQTTPHLIRGSASSYIYHGDQELRGPSGWRVLALVTDASDIPRAGAVIYQRSWLAGHGRISVSRAGYLLARGLVDASVWQPERLDFCGGAACTPPLEQRLPPPLVFNADAQPLDTRAIVLDLIIAEQEEYERLLAEAKAAVDQEAREIRDAWVETRIQETLDAEGVEGDAARSERAKELRETFDQAVHSGVLLGDFQLVAESGEVVTVGEILDNPDKWHGRRFADPLEPDYRGDKRIAWANLRAAGRPYIYSHAHGGRRFKLHRARRNIRLVAGERQQIVNKTIELLRIDGGVFERGGELVRVAPSGEVLPMDLDRMQFYLDGLVRWWRFDKRSEEWRPVDCPPAVAKGVQACRGSWSLPELKAVVTAPTLNPDTGQLIERDGYDASSGDAVAAIPRVPFRRSGGPGRHAHGHPHCRGPGCPRNRAGVPVHRAHSRLGQDPARPLPGDPDRRADAGGPAPDRPG